MSEDNIRGIDSLCPADRLLKLGPGMSNFARDRRSPRATPDKATPIGGSVTALVEASESGRPRRRAFDLIENLELLRRQPAPTTERLHSAVELRAAEMLMSIAHALAPTAEEVRDIAARHGISGALPDLLRNPAVAIFVAERFPCQQPDRVTCRAYYEAHAEAFRGPDLYQGGEILIGGDVTDRDWRSEAYSRAERIIAMLHYDRRVFDDLLACATATSGDRGGRIGPVSKGGWDSTVAAPFFSLKAGEVFPLPVPSEQGFHILLMERIAPGPLRPFAEVEGDVVRRLAERSRLAAATRHLEALASQAPT